MNINKVMDIISNSTIDKNAMYELINDASKMNLKDEKNIRSIIRRGAKIANKTIDSAKEDEIVNLIMKEGIGPNLLKSFS